jgi:hypothetical protein
MLPESLSTYPTAAALGRSGHGGKFEFGELTVEVAPENILAALRRLKHDLKFERLSTVTGVDRYPAEPRFEVVYHLQSITQERAHPCEGAAPGRAIRRSNRPCPSIAPPTGMNAKRSICSACAS